MKDFHSGTEGLICQKNCEGWMVGVWEGLNLGSIPNDHMPSQKDPKISIERRCSTILPKWFGSSWCAFFPVDLLMDENAGPCDLSLGEKTIHRGYVCERRGGADKKKIMRFKCRIPFF